MRSRLRCGRLLLECWFIKDSLQVGDLQLELDQPLVENHLAFDELPV